jgi:WD40 repeat protein
VFFSSLLHSVEYRIPAFLDEFVNLKQLVILEDALVTLDHFPNLPHLTQLTISHSRISSIQPITHLRSLRELTLEGNHSLRSVSFSGLHRLQNLVKLSLAGSRIENLLPLVEEVRRIKSLRVLRLMVEPPLEGMDPTASSHEQQPHEGQRDFSTHARSSIFSDIVNLLSPFRRILTSLRTDQQPGASEHASQHAVSESVIRETREDDEDGSDYMDADPSASDEDEEVSIDDGEEELSEDAFASATVDDYSDDLDDDYEDAFSDDSSRSMSRYPQYRAFVVASVPQLLVLDGKRILQQERMDAVDIVDAAFEDWQSSEENIWKTCWNLSLRRDAHLSHRRAFSACRHLSPYPRYEVLTAPSASPRQFEYHPSRSELIVYGTLDGYVSLVDSGLSHERNGLGSMLLGASQAAGQNNFRGRAILGLCWLKTEAKSHLFLAGTDSGMIHLVDSSKIRDLPHEAALSTYTQTQTLTSVNCNATDHLFASSGYEHDVSLFNFELPRPVQILRGLHTEHINVVKFANHAPNLLMSSSFDRSVKLWDIRTPNGTAVWTYQMRSPTVMAVFSPDDRFILASGVDNNVVQIDVRTGTTNLDLQIPRMPSAQNYTRSYYMNQGNYIVSGSSQEACVRIICTRTARLLREVEFPPTIFEQLCMLRLVQHSLFLICSMIMCA